MSPSLNLLLLLLSASVAMMAVGKPRIEVVALLALLILPLFGLVTLPQALSGFSDPNVILIALMFVIGEGLVRTGVAYRLGHWLVERGGNSESRLVVMMMLAVTGLGAFMSSTGVVAIFLPVVLNVARQLKVHPGRLLMPLSFAGLISGMQTLVATPPNLVLDSALDRAGVPGFSFFSFTPIGLVVLGMGIGYMLVARRWLPNRPARQREHDRRRSFRDLITDYRLEGHGHCLRILPDSPLVGHSLKDLALRRRFSLNVLGVERRGPFRNELLNPGAHFELRAGDLLLVDAISPLDLPEELGLKETHFRGSYLTDQSREVGMAEVLIPPESDLIGSTIHQAEFRTVHSANVVGLRRGGSPFEGPYLEEKLRAADTLLVVGPWKAIRQLQAQRQDFIVLSLPAEADAAAPALSQAPLALLSLVVMVLLMITGVVPNVLAALIGCLMMGAFRCIDFDSAVRSIHWSSVIVIVGMMPFAAALEQAGGVELAVERLDLLADGLGPRGLLAVMFLLTSVLGLFISNTATAVLVAPLAISIAEQVGASPRPFAMTVAIAASAAFMTPVSSPVNTLVLGPGEFKFFDFVKVGVPFTALILAITLLLVPLLFPF